VAGDKDGEGACTDYGALFGVWLVCEMDLGVDGGVGGIFVGGLLLRDKLGGGEGRVGSLIL